MLVAAIVVAVIPDTAYPQARPNPAGQPSASNTAQQIAAAKVKAWTLFYAGKYESAASAAQPLLRCGQHDAEQEATHLVARCLWAADTPKTRAEAQQAWQQLDKPLGGSANHLRLDIAKALVLDASGGSGTVKTTEAIELLERDSLLSGNSGGTAQAEAAIELAALYAEDGKTDKAGKLLDAIGPFFAAQNLTRLELDQADVAPFLKAAAAARAGLSADHSPGLAEFQHAEALRASGRYQDAFKAYQLVIAKFPATDFAPHSQLCLGYCELGMNPTKPQQAVERWKAFAAASPSGPWRGQAYVALIDTYLDPLLDLGQAGQEADAAATAMETAASDGSGTVAAPSWKLAAYDLQVRLGTVRLLQGRSQSAADAFDAAIQIHGDSGDAGQGLVLLDSAAKSGQSVLPADVRQDAGSQRSEVGGRVSNGPDDKIALALAIGTIDNVTAHFAAANALFTRLAKATNASGMTPARIAYANFGSGMALEKLEVGGQGSEVGGQRSAVGNETAKSAFITSLKAYPLGTPGGWHDETLYRLAMLIQGDVGGQKSEAGGQTPKPNAKKPGITDAGSAVPNIAEQTLARDAKADAAKQEALPYWQELLAKYPNSPRIDAAEYYGGIAAANVEAASPPLGMHTASGGDAASTNAGPDNGIALLQKLIKDHPQSPFVGDAAIRVIDVALEQQFDLKRAKELSAAGLNAEVGGQRSEVSALPTSDLRPPTSVLAPWRRSGYEFTPTPPDRVKYELYLRQGLVEYLEGNYEKATAAFNEAGPEQPVSQIGGTVDLAHIGLHYLVEAAHQKKSVTTDAEVFEDTKTDQQRTAVNLGNIYLEGIRPDKADEVFTRILTGDPVLGHVSNALKGYAILQLGVAIDREGRRQEALDWFKQLAYSPQFAGSFWQPYGLFRLAVFTHNLTQDRKQSMALWRQMLAKYPDHPRAEDAMFFYLDDAMQVKDYKLARSIDAEFRARYPHSVWIKTCNKFMSEIPTGGSK